MTRILNQHTALTRKIKKSKLDLEFAISTDPLQVRPVVTQKTKKQTQDRPAELLPDQWPPALTHFHATAQTYTAMELMGWVQGFGQKPRETVPAWL